MHTDFGPNTLLAHLEQYAGTLVYHGFKQVYVLSLRWQLLPCRNVSGEHRNMGYVILNATSIQICVQFVGLEIWEECDRHQPERAVGKELDNSERSFADALAGNSSNFDITRAFPP